MEISANYISMIRNLHPKYIMNANDPKRQIIESKKRKEFQQIFLQDKQMAKKKSSTWLIIRLKCMLNAC